MTVKTAVVFTCSHADPSVTNERFEWLGKLIFDVKPDYVIDLGDGAEMASLNSYDSSSSPSFHAQSYEKDIEAYNDAQEKLRHPFRKSKKRKPAWFGLEGNHEHRIKKAIEKDSRLGGDKFGISFKHLQTNQWFDEYHEYTHKAPAIADYDGVSYAHFFASGSLGNPISGTHHAHSIINARLCSSTCGHSHKRSFFPADYAHPRPILGLVAGCFKGQDSGWAGQANKQWWHGVVIKRGIDQGSYDPEFVSLRRLRQVYGG